MIQASCNLRISDGVSLVSFIDQNQSHRKSKSDSASGAYTQISVPRLINRVGL